MVQGQPPLTGIQPQISTVRRVTNLGPGGRPCPVPTPAPHHQPRNLLHCITLASLAAIWLAPTSPIGLCTPGGALHSARLPSAQAILASSVSPPPLPVPSGLQKGQVLPHTPNNLPVVPSEPLFLLRMTPALSLPLALLCPVPAGVLTRLPSPRTGRQRSIDSEGEVCVCLGAGSRKSNNSGKT